MHGLLRATRTFTSKTFVVLALVLTLAQFYACDDRDVITGPEAVARAPRSPAHSTAGETAASDIEAMQQKIDAFVQDGSIDNKGIANGLRKLLGQASDKAQAGRHQPSENMMRAFQNRVRAQRGKHIREAAADQLHKAGQDVIDVLDGTASPNRADLSVQLTAEPDPVNVGRELTHTITIANAGPDPVTGIDITLQVIGDVTLAAASVPSVCTAVVATDGSGATVACTLADLAPAANTSLTLPVAPQTAGEDLLSQADITNWTGAEDLDLSNNLASASTHVNTPPSATITSPADNGSFDEGEAITFAGTVSDAEDQASELMLTWESSLDGAIGTGASFTRSDLSLGTHTITLTAADPDGAQGIASVTATVDKTIDDLEPGLPITATLQTSDEIDRYGFAVSTCSRVQFRISPAGGSTLQGTLSVVDPGGNSAGSTNFGPATGLLIVDMAEPGEYIVEVRPTANTPGAYDLEAECAVVIALDSNTQGTLEGPGQPEVFYFTGTTGMLVNVAYAEDDVLGRAYLYLYAPDGTLLFQRRAGTNFGTTFNATGVTALPADGVYRVVVEGVDAGSAGPFILGLSRIEPPTPIALAAPYITETGGVGILGDVRFYRFDGAEHQAITMSINTPGTLHATLLMRLPGAEPFYDRAVFGGLFGSTRTTCAGCSAELQNVNIGRLSLPEAGEYIIQVGGGGSGSGVSHFTGSYNLRVFNPELVPADFDTQISGTIDPAFEFDRYSFAVSQTRAVLIRAVHSVGQYLNTRLFDAVDSPIAGARSSPSIHTAASHEIIAQVTNGSYVIEQERSDGTVGGYEFQIVTLEPPVALAAATPTSGEIDIAGERDYYSFTGTTGTMATVEVSVPATSALVAQFRIWSLRTDGVFTGPGAMVFRDDHQRIHPGQADARLITLPADGTYIIVVDGILGSPGGASTGGYTIEISQ